MGRPILVCFYVCFCGAAMLTACASKPGHPSAAIEPQTPAAKYLATLQTAIGDTRATLPTMTASADAAAKRVVAGGKLLASGSQHDFVVELCGRAGGLMGIAPLTDSGAAGSGDVVLYAARGVMLEEDRLRIKQLRGRGAYVVVFGLQQNVCEADARINSGHGTGTTLSLPNKICPTDSVVNIINGWTWTGEYIAACTRLGKMPTVYRSVHLDGGRERIEKYKGKTFHDDMTISPIPPNVLGAAYLDALAKALSAIRSDSLDDIHTGAIKLREATPAHSTLLVMGHMFPAHYHDARAPQPFGKMARLEENQPPADAQFTLVLGYQKPPTLAIAAAHVNREMLIYSSVQRAADDRVPFIRYIDPHFPLEDGCVTIKGYDVSALPESGVVQAAIYWSLVAEAFPASPAAAR